MKSFRADAGHAKADTGYAQADKGYAPRCPADGGVMEQVSIRIETIDDSPQNYSIYKCKECKRYLADGGKLVKSIDDKQAAAKILNELRHPEEPYTASEILLVEES
jgi:hypothetical protein